MENNENLERELKEKVLKNFEGEEAYIEFFSFTLKNFAYRYFESESTGPVKEGSSGPGEFFVEAFEDHFATALKTKNGKTRKGLIEMAKSFSKKDKPAVRYRLGVQIKNKNAQGGGKFLLFSEVHWDFPTYENKEKVNSAQLSVSFEDPLEMRNTFAKHLEEICDVF